VLCNPFGYEAICAHRAYRHLAERLAQRGVWALRFDYDGTGDSFGDDAESARVRGWIDSIHLAIDELWREGVDQVFLFGMRLGGLLALHAACERDDVSGLALWAPVSNGRAYLRELKALRAIHEDAAASRARRAPTDDSAAEEAAGFLLSSETMKDLEGLDVRKLSGCSAERALLIARAELPSDLRFAEHMKSLGLEVSAEALPGYPAALLDPHKSELPHALFQRVERWIGETVPNGRSKTASAQLSAPAPRTIGPSLPVRERALRFEPSNIFGILAERSTDGSRAARAELGVVLLNAGAIHRIGMNRMYVSLARRWATRGAPTLRLDISGIGDSPAAPGTPENRIYSKHAVPDVITAIDRMSESNVAQHYALLGLCSGAYAAFHSAVADPRVACVMLINPQTFEYNEGDSLDVQKRKNFREARYYQRSLLRPASWLKALRGDVDFRYIGQVMYDRACVVTRSRLRSARQRLSGRKTQSALFRELLRLCDRGCDVCLVYSSDDPGLDHFYEQVGSGYRAIAAHPRFSLRIIEGPDHTFTPRWSQAELTEVLDECLAKARTRLAASGTLLTTRRRDGERRQST
jgi:alpha-beta hydrolase superfamily lysophospholipase